MNDTLAFLEYSRQSSKGILIIFIKKIYDFIKKAWYFIPMLIFGKSNPDKLQKVLLGFGILLLFILIKSILDFLYFKFKIKDNHFLLKEGVFNKKQLSIPFERIQNINFKQNLVQQLINITQVEIETAGAKKTEISIKALDRTKAEALKSIIFNSKKMATAFQEEKLVTKPILKISFSELVKVAITENHFKSFIIFIAFLSMIYSQIKDTFKDFSIKETVGVDIENQTPNSFYGFIIFSIIAFIIGLIISFIRIFLRHFDLTLFLKNNTIELVQGLFTKRQHILKKEKVQHITVSTNPLKKLLGISSIVFKQANSVQNKLIKQIRIVGCEKEPLNTVKNMLYTKHQLNNEKMLKPHKYYIFKMALRSFIFITLLNLIVIIPMYFDSETPANYNFLFINLIIIPFAIYMIYIKFKKAYFKFNENILIKNFGQIGSNTTYFEYFKLQSIKKKQTIFMKHRGVTDVVLITAIGAIKLPCVPIETANKIYNYFIYQTEISTKKWM